MLALLKEEGCLQRVAHVVAFRVDTATVLFAVHVRGAPKLCDEWCVPKPGVYENVFKIPVIHCVACSKSSSDTFTQTPIFPTYSRTCAPLLNAHRRLTCDSLPPSCCCRRMHEYTCMFYVAVVCEPRVWLHAGHIRAHVCCCSDRAPWKTTHTDAPRSVHA